MAKTFLLVGLGNPGLKYARNRHNVGRMVLDGLIGERAQARRRALRHGSVLEVADGRARCVLLWPATAMNLTGISVEEACSEYGIPPENVCVFQDDMDLPLGTVRMKLGGSDSGHRGLNSVSSSLGGEYHRLRVGIGRPPEGQSVFDFVLGDFDRSELVSIDRVCDILHEKTDALLAGDLEAVRAFIDQKLRRLTVAAENPPSDRATVMRRPRYGDISPLGEIRRRAIAEAAHLPSRIRRDLGRIRKSIRTRATEFYAGYSRRQSNARVIGITGSSAKTTTTSILAHILSAKHKLRLQLDANTLGRTRNTLSSLERDDEFAVMELGASYPGSIADMAQIVKPDVGIITMVGREHFSAFRSREAVAHEKADLARALRDDGLAILNADDPLVSAMAAEISCKVVTFGTGNADYVCSDLQAGIEGIRFNLHFGSRVLPISSPLIGRRNWLALTGAAACALELGVPDDIVARQIAGFGQLFGRLSAHPIEGGPVFVMDIVKAPYDSIPSTLEELAALEAPRKRFILGGISDYPGDPAPKYAEIYRNASQVADEVIYVGEISHRARASAEDVAAGRFSAFTEFEDLSRHLKATAVPGEIIFLKGSRSHHLDRLWLDWQTEVRCWARTCGRKAEFCNQCGLYQRPYLEHLGKRSQRRGLRRLFSSIGGSGKDGSGARG